MVRRVFILARFGLRHGLNVRRVTLGTSDLVKPTVPAHPTRLAMHHSAHAAGIGRRVNGAVCVGRMLDLHHGPNVVTGGGMVRHAGRI
jgi:hypothetical protein